jgi:hypothetical protein
MLQIKATRTEKTNGNRARVNEFPQTHALYHLPSGHRSVVSQFQFGAATAWSVAPAEAEPRSAPQCGHAPQTAVRAAYSCSFTRTRSPSSAAAVARQTAYAARPARSDWLIPAVMRHRLRHWAEWLGRHRRSGSFMRCPRCPVSPSCPAGALHGLAPASAGGSCPRVGAAEYAAPGLDVAEPPACRSARSVSRAKGNRGVRGTHRGRTAAGLFFWLSGKLRAGHCSRTTRGPRVSTPHTPCTVPTLPLCSLVFAGSSQPASACLLSL